MFRISHYFQRSCYLHKRRGGSRLGYTRPTSGEHLLTKLVTFTAPSLSGGSANAGNSEVVRDLGGLDVARSRQLPEWVCWTFQTYLFLETFE